MKIQKHAVSLACLAVLGMAGSAHALQVAEGFEVIGNVYPEYRIDSFTDGDTTSTRSTMLRAVVNNKVQTTQTNWTNSYLGVKGQRAFGDVRLGFELQQTIDQARTLPATTAFGDARASYVFIDSTVLGTRQMGRVDTI